MQLTKTHKIIISIGTIAVLLGIYISFDKRIKQQGGENVNSNIVSTTTSMGINIKGTGDYTIEQVPLDKSGGIPKPIPDLNRAVTPPSSGLVPTDAIVVATKNILSLQSQLKKDPSDFSSWLNLAMYQKMAGDYKGAVLSLEYASRLAPSDYIALGNLGNIYAYFLKDNVKAESYYKQAIFKGQTQSNLYVQLAEFYGDFLNDKVKALSTVEDGLKKIPGDPNLLQLKDSLQK